MSKKHAPLSRKEEEEQKQTINRRNSSSMMADFNTPMLKMMDMSDHTMFPAAENDTYKTKSNVSQPGDPAEVQADAVAKAVTEGNANAAQVELQNTLSGEGITAKATDVTIETPPGFDEQVAKMKGGGLPLPDDKKTNLEEMLGTDLDHVRLHTGADAASLSDQINALAFATGDDIFYPGDLNDEELLAHEVAHVVQEGAGFDENRQMKKSPVYRETDVESRASQIAGKSEEQIKIELEGEYIISISDTWSIITILMLNQNTSVVNTVTATAQRWLVDRPDFIHYIEDLARFPKGLRSDFAIKLLADAGYENAYLDKDNYKRVVSENGILIRMMAVELLFSLSETKPSGQAYVTADIDTLWVKDILTIIENDTCTLNELIAYDFRFNKVLHIYAGVKVGFDIMDGIAVAPLGVNDTSKDYARTDVTSRKTYLLGELNQLRGEDTDETAYSNIAGKLNTLPLDMAQLLHNTVYQTMLDVLQAMEGLPERFAQFKYMQGTPLVFNARSVEPDSPTELNNRLVKGQIDPLISTTSGLITELSSLKPAPDNLESYIDSIITIQGKAGKVLIKSQMIEVERYLLTGMGFKGIDISTWSTVGGGLTLKIAMYNMVMKILNLIELVDTDMEGALSGFNAVISGTEFADIQNGLANAGQAYTEFHETAQKVKIVAMIILPMYAGMVARIGGALLIRTAIPQLYAWGTRTLVGRVAGFVSSVLLESLVFETVFKLEKGELGKEGFWSDYWRTAGLFGALRLLNIGYLDKIRPAATTGAAQKIQFEIVSGASHFAVLHAWSVLLEAYDTGKKLTPSRHFELAIDNIMMLGYLRLVTMATEPLFEEAAGKFKKWEVKNINKNLVLLFEQAKAFEKGDINYLEVKKHAKKISYYLDQRIFIIEELKAAEKNTIDNKSASADDKAAAQRRYDEYNLGIENSEALKNEVDYTANFVVKYNLHQFTSFNGLIHFEGPAADLKADAIKRGYKEVRSTGYEPEGIMRFIHPVTGMEITFVQTSGNYRYEKGKFSATPVSVAQVRNIDFVQAKDVFGSDGSIELNTYLKLAMEYGWRPEMGRDAIHPDVKELVKRYNTELLTKEYQNSTIPLTDKAQDKLSNLRPVQLQFLIALSPVEADPLNKITEYFENVLEKISSFEVHDQYALVIAEGKSLAVIYDAKLLGPELSAKLYTDIPFALELNTIIENKPDTSRPQTIQDMLIILEKMQNTVEFKKGTDLIGYEAIRDFMITRNYNKGEFDKVTELVSKFSSNGPREEFLPELQAFLSTLQPAEQIPALDLLNSASNNKIVREAIKRNPGKLKGLEFYIREKNVMGTSGTILSDAARLDTNPREEVPQTTEWQNLNDQLAAEGNKLIALGNEMIAEGDRTNDAQLRSRGRIVLQRGNDMLLGIRSYNTISSRTSVRDNMQVDVVYGEYASYFQSHHVIVVSAIRQSALIRRAIELGFDFNGEMNAINLTTFSDEFITSSYKIKIIEKDGVQHAEVKENKLFGKTVITNGTVIEQSGVMRITEGANSVVLQDGIVGTGKAKGMRIPYGEVIATINGKTTTEPVKSSPLGVHASHNTYNAKQFERFDKKEKELIDEYGSFDKIPDDVVIKTVKSEVRDLKRLIRKNKGVKVNDLTL